MSVTCLASLPKPDRQWTSILVCLWLALWSLAGLAQELQPIPPLAAHVTDMVGLLPADQRAALEERLVAIEKKHGAQVAVLIVPSTKPEGIEQYAIRVADAWKLGRKGIDDGLLIVLASQDRRLRLEVGRGLEGAIPDAIAKRIIADIAAPRFKQGDFPGGLNAAVDQIDKLIAGEALPAPKQNSQAGPEGKTDLEGLLALGMIATVLVGGFLRALFGQLPGALIVGGMVGVGVWILTGLFLMGLAASVISFLFSLFMSLGGRGGGGYIGGGGWSSGGGSSGWSGGGGGFGGGGASGDW